MNLLEQKYRAPEIYGDHWFNSEPIPISALRGQIILIDFWDSTDQNSLRGIHYVKEWHKRYSEFGLVVVGVHTPKFPFSGDPWYVQKAIQKNNIRYPVVTDNAHQIWSSYKTRLHPTRVLIDKSGYIRIIHEGEGSYQSFENAIQTLLADIGFHGEFPMPVEPIREEDKHGIHCFRATPEIQVGYQRGTIGNTDGYFPESVFNYSDPGYYLEGRIYLCGNWLVNKHFIKLENIETEEGYLILRYQAKEVNVVIKPEGEKNFQVFVIQDGKYLSKTDSGKDICLDEEGKSYFLIDEAKLYNIVNNNEFGEHVLKLSSFSNGFSFYSISFVSAPISELISGR